MYCMASRGTVAETKFSVSKGSELVQSWMRCWGASLRGPASLGFVLASASKYALKRYMSPSFRKMSLRKCRLGEWARIPAVATSDGRKRGPLALPPGPPRRVLPQRVRKPPRCLGVAGSSSVFPAPARRGAGGAPTWGVPLWLRFLSVTIPAPTPASAGWMGFAGGGWGTVLEGEPGTHMTRALWRGPRHP